MKVYLVFTDAGLYGVYKTRKLAKYAADEVSNKFNVRTWVENRLVVEEEPKTFVLFGPTTLKEVYCSHNDEDYDIQ